MDKIQFLKDIESLNYEIIDYYKPFETDEPKRKIIRDGIVNIENYYDSNPKIMWILKEAYDEVDNMGGGWSLVEDLDTRRATGVNRTSWQTFDKIIYTTFCILNEFIQFEEIPYKADDIRLCSVLKNIAYINIQKLPATKTSDDKLIEQALIKHKDILLKQINTINPDIIINCSMQNIRKAFDGKLNENIIYSQSYHPANRRRSTKDFVNKIVAQIKSK